MTTPIFWLTIEGKNLSDITIADVSLSIGRETVYDAVMPADISIKLVAASVNILTQVGNHIELFADIDGPLRLFNGRITDVTTNLDVLSGLWTHQITAMGPLAELGSTPAGATDYPQETDSQRIARILNEVQYSILGVPAGMPGPELISITASDASSMALDLLNIAMKSGNGLLWEDHHANLIRYVPRILRSIGRPAIWETQPGNWDDLANNTWNDIQLQAAAFWDTTEGTWDDNAFAWNAIDEQEKPIAPWELDPSIIVKDEWQWEQTIGDLITWVEISWGTETIGGVWVEGNLNPPVYGKTLSTQLAQLTDAQELANRIYITHQLPRWNLPEIRMRLSAGDDSHRTDLLELLLGGRPVLINPLPKGSPVGPSMLGFLEGWDHHIVLEKNTWFWEIVLHVSPAELTAPMTIWDYTGTLTWNEIDDPWNTLILSGIG